MFSSWNQVNAFSPPQYVLQSVIESAFGINRLDALHSELHEKWRLKWSIAAMRSSMQVQCISWNGAHYTMLCYSCFLLIFN